MRSDQATGVELRGYVQALGVPLYADGGGEPGGGSGVGDARRAWKASWARRRAMPAHLAKASGVAGPKTWRKRRASSRRASRGSTSGAGTVQMVGARAPSHEIRIVPVGAA